MVEAHSYPFLFLIVPIMVFGPILGLLLWMFDIKSLFFHLLPQEERILGDRKENSCKKIVVQFEDSRPTPLMLVCQVLAYSAFAVVVGLFSVYPSYQYTDEKSGQLKLSLSYSGRHKVACREREPAELEALPPNMRSMRACERERLPVTVVLTLDKRILLKSTVPPAGLARDGASSFYKTFIFPVGYHSIDALLDDGEATFLFERTFFLSPRQILIIGFTDGHFYLK